MEILQYLKRNPQQGEEAKLLVLKHRITSQYIWRFEAVWELQGVVALRNAGGCAAKDCVES